MKILVVGCSGTLGKELAEVLRTGNNVIGLNSRNLDIRDREAVFNCLATLKPDLVINSSAFNDVDGAERSAELHLLADQVNNLGVGYLAEATQQIGAVFLTYSTDYVFDGQLVAYAEEEATSPISNYGRSKAEGEKKVIATGGKYYIVRISRLFNCLFLSSQNGKKSFFQKILDASVGNNKLKVICDETSCFSYAPDVAKASRKLIEGIFPSGIYHFVNQGPATWYEGARALFDALEIRDVELIPVLSDQLVRPAKRPKSSILLNTKFPPLRHYEETFDKWARKIRT